MDVISIRSRASSNESDSSCASKFKATALWNNMVMHLQKNVKQKRRRLLLKGVGPTECFSGSDFCDTALLYLLVDNENFRTSDITRDKARKLCQLLLDNDVCEPLGTTDKRFEDHSSKYYKFSLPYVPGTSNKNCDHRSNSAPELQADILQSSRKRKCYSEEETIDEEVFCNPAAEYSQLELDPEQSSLTSSSNDSAHSTEDNSNRGEECSHLRNITNQYEVKRELKTKRSPLGSLDQKLRASLRGRHAKKITDQLFRKSSGGESSEPKLTRSMSTGTGTPGMYRRKTSSSSVRSQTSSASAAGKPPTHPKSRAKRILTEGLEPDTQGCSVNKIAKITGEVIFSPAAIADIRQEIALSQLSQLIELPILEGLICGSFQSVEDPCYDNAVFFDICQQTGFDTDDVWIQLALEVIDHIPNGHKLTLDYHIGSNMEEYKLALYRAILKMYRTRVEPLLPLAHEAIYQAVLSLVLSGQEKLAVRATRLACILLPCYLMAEISALLQFLQVLCVKGDPKIRAGQNNNDVVLNDYCGILFMEFKLLSPDQRRILLLFLMRHSSELSKVPSSVQMILEQTMQNLKKGDDTPLPSAQFCYKVTKSQLESQTQEYTEMSIVSMIRQVIDDTKISLKEKQKTLKHVQKHHHPIMMKYFGELI